MILARWECRTSFLPTLFISLQSTYLDISCMFCGRTFGEGNSVFFLRSSIVSSNCRTAQNSGEFITLHCRDGLASKARALGKNLLHGQSDAGIVDTGRNSQVAVIGECIMPSLPIFPLHCAVEPVRSESFSGIRSWPGEQP